MFKNESLRTLSVAFVICLLCSVLVSFVAVVMKPEQTNNKILDRNSNILQAAGLYKPGMSDADIMAEFEHFQPAIVDLESGKFVSAAELKSLSIDPSNYDQDAAAKDPKLSISLVGNDPAGIGRLPKYAKVYIMKQGDKIEQIVLPVKGYGLWSMMHGFVALGNDLNTILGLGFYQQGETPGLGGEVDNPKWKALWPGKKTYDEQGNVIISVAKGKAMNENQIDGLSGATLTTRGVDNLVKFWLGDRGFKPFLTNLKNAEA